jgi:hypothetical protein
MELCGEDPRGVAGASVWLDRPCFEDQHWQVASEAWHHHNPQVHKGLDPGRFGATGLSRLAASDFRSKDGGDILR